MSDHELNARTPALRQRVSMRSRQTVSDASGSADIANRGQAGFGCLAIDDSAVAFGNLVAALSSTASTDWAADLDQPSTAADRQALRFARLTNAPARTPPNTLDSQLALHQAACATAVADDRERIARDLYDKVIHRLFGAGLQLQATCQVVDSQAQTRLEITIDLLDTTITELRKAIFSLH